ncbi:hypothetical protein [Candidatus Pelagisphaera phototrophica]|uniref:hypothetical protein n=1 Tax=Candidatus Pelagisphaera phototrophica TaxID=2684113 RepID=UPI001A0B154B|nr:hypothetical protein [Candidatus Pelagisphaera phototrophica]QXD32841.1 hypothetical protein GA004_03745 [Candidatus Pelagisphaera phototrophica]
MSLATWMRARTWPWMRLRVDLPFPIVEVALVHALEYPIGNQYQSTHGTGVGIVLP